MKQGKISQYSKKFNFCLFLKKKNEIHHFKHFFNKKKKEQGENEAKLNRVNWIYNTTDMS